MFSNMSNRKTENLISVEEFARNVANTFPEVTDYEIRRWAIIFTFDVYLQGVGTSSQSCYKIFPLEHQQIAETSLIEFIHQMRIWLSNSTVLPPE